MHQNISTLKQNSTIKQIEISRVTNSIRAFLFLLTPDMQHGNGFLPARVPANSFWNSSRPCSCSSRAAALPLNASSISTTQLSPSLSCTHQSAEKQAQKDGLQPQEAWQRKWAKMTHQRSQHTKGMPNKGQIYEFLIEFALSSSNFKELMILKNTSEEVFPRASPLSLLVPIP